MKHCASCLFINVKPLSYPCSDCAETSDYPQGTQYIQNTEENKDLLRVVFKSNFKEIRTACTVCVHFIPSVSSLQQTDGSTINIGHICKHEDSCLTTEDAPHGTHWEFDKSEYAHPCPICANEGCYPQVDVATGEHKTCSDVSGFYKFILKTDRSENLMSNKAPGHVAVQGVGIAPEGTPVRPIDDGSAATSPHYNSLPIQPLMLMEAVMTREEFLGFLKGNMIKYAMRAGKKDAVAKDVTKYNQYKEFYLTLVHNPSTSISDLL